MRLVSGLITAKSPDGRGKEIGERFGANIRETVDSYLEFFRRSGITDTQSQEIGESCLAALNEWAPHLSQEIRCIAGSAGIEVWKLAALNARTEVKSILGDGAPAECSTAVYVPADGSTPKSIQTWDWLEVMCKEGLIATYTPDPRAVGKPIERVVTFTEFGMLAKIGVNSSGLGVHLNILTHRSDHGVAGVPVHAVIRRILDEATTVEEAEAIVRSATYAASSVLTVVSRGGSIRAACFELSPKRVSRVTSNADGWLLHTNHFIADEQADGAFVASEARSEERLRHLETQRSHMVQGSISDRAAAMCGELGELAPVCFLPDPSLSEYAQWETLLTAGFDLDDPALELFPGTPAALVAHGVQRFAA